MKLLQHYSTVKSRDIAAQQQREPVAKVLGHQKPPSNGPQPIYKSSHVAQDQIFQPPTSLCLKNLLRGSMLT